MKKEFKAVFQLSKLTLFEVRYYTLGQNEKPHFATSAETFMKNKREFNRCGQCQKDVLHGEAYKFWLKWDKHHLKDLDENTYHEMVADMEKLKEKYNYIYKEYDESKKPYSDYYFNFDCLVDFSKQTPKK